MQETILVFFQNIANPQLDIIAQWITILGEQYTYIIVISFLYWCGSKKSAIKLIYCFINSTLINNLIKIIFQAPRPFEVLSSIHGKRLHTATGYSFPSGHTQSSSTFLTALALMAKKTWFWIIAVILMLAIAASRVYLGVHWPVDVIAALILGVFWALLFSYLVDQVYSDPSKFTKLLMISEGMILFATIMMVILQLFFFKNITKLSDFYKISGLSLGVFSGIIAEKKFIQFDAQAGNIVQKVLRFTIGLGLTMIIFIFLQAVLLNLPVFHYFRYCFIGIWMTFLYPALGSKVKLFSRF
ncbi:MAG: phosphatase PAP2 family protein [Spirochaetes bacterium]|nr:phosphatase PAP2 family protein [Spirochaetota bacterium]